MISETRISEITEFTEISEFTEFTEFTELCYSILEWEISRTEQIKQIQQRPPHLASQHTVGSICTFGLLYFTVATPLSVYSGLNINYMLSPPLIDPVLEMGEWYRIGMFGGLSVLFAGARIVTIAVVVLGEKVRELCNSNHNRDSKDK